MADHAALVRRALDPGVVGEFDRRVRAQADRLAAAVEDGAFDNEAPTVGLELEAYAVDAENCRLAPVPDDVFEGPAAKELGVHDVELNAAPTRMTGDGIDEQAAALERDLAATRDRLHEHGLELVLDAMWTVPPEGGTRAYLDDVVIDRGDASESAGADETDDGRTAGGAAPVMPGPGSNDPVVVARHMRRDPRYGALDNEAVRRAGGAIPFEVPGASLSFRTILFESLATSIQPHVQVPDVSQFPQYHNLAVRTMGPVLALSTNSPFLPADCYDADPQTVVEEGHHELRIAAFEQSMNQGFRKVCVPEDVETATDVVDAVAADETFGPFLREWVDDDWAGGDGTDSGVDPAHVDDCWEFDYKRGTVWRWVRGVVCGAAVEGACDERSLRIEYRPVPTQPTVRDIVGIQALTVGLLRGLVAAGHPLGDLDWAAAERSFYAAVEDGLDADLTWVTADGERTDDPEEVFGEVFAFARRGLEVEGVPADVQDRYLDPIEARWEQGVTPSMWKRRQVRDALDDDASLDEAMARMQCEYARLSREHETFVEWLD